MIKKILGVIRTCKEAVMVRSSPVITTAEAVRYLTDKHKANKLHNDILTGKAPRGRTKP